MRNLLSGNQTEVRFSSTEELEEANVTTGQATYLYADHAGYHFMYKESYEEITLSDEESCLFMTSDNNSLDFEDNQQLEEPSIEIEQIELGELIS